MKGVGLVLEGGGMRGIFTAGVLDFFLDFGIRFDYIIGSSAGASNGLSYASGQRGRARALNSDFLEKYSYIGFMRLLKSGCIMDYKLLFEDIPLRLYPFDFDSYISRQPRYIMCATSCADGCAHYFEKCSSYERTIAICRASCSMPFLCPIAKVDGECFLDGGIADSIPLAKSIADGNLRNVVVLTRNAGYRKHPEKLYIPPFFYAHFPKLRTAICKRNAMYNEAMDFVERNEASGDALVIRPKRRLIASRIEKRAYILKDLYAQGYECAKDVFLKNPDFFRA